MHTLNLGILAHVDAGKTSLTERLLYTAGVIDTLGSVDAGNTQTDSLALERQRGITIKSAVMSFTIDDVTVNLIDTPGHPDFIAEVERVLSVLDGAVLVISAVEGVQPQTRVLMRTLQRLAVPTLIYVNKIDRRGAGDAAGLPAIRARLTPAVVAMGTTSALGTPDAAFTAYGAGDTAFADTLADLLTSHDDTLLAAYLRTESAMPYDRLRRVLAGQTGRALVHPVFFGSAITGAGIGSLIEGIKELLPAASSDRDGQLSGTIFKIERGRAGEKIAYVRMFDGTLRARDRIDAGRNGAKAKVTAISVFDGGPAAPRDEIAAGQIGKLWGLPEIKIGDTLGAPRTGSRAGGALEEHRAGGALEEHRAGGALEEHRAGGALEEHRAGGELNEHRVGFFDPPTLETVVVPVGPRGNGADHRLHVALSQLAEQDPLINLRRDDVRSRVLLSLYGEVQKQVIGATLADEYGIEIEFEQTTTICIERPAGVGAAAERIKAEGNPFLAGIGLRVEPAQAGAGVRFGLEIELGALPYSFIKAIEETVHETLRQGIYGWQVTDCQVTLIYSAYYPRQSHAHAHFDKSMSSTAGDFRSLTPLVLMAALREAGTTVLEPMHRFELELPADTLGSTLPVLAKLGATPGRSVSSGTVSVLEGEIPAASVHQFRQQLPGLTRGEYVLDCAFHRYQPVRGPNPARAITRQ